MQAFLEKYEIQADGIDLGAYFEAARKEYEARGNAIMDFERYHAFTYMTEDIRRIRDELVLDPDNVLYAYFLNAALRANNSAAIDALSYPRRERRAEIYDTLPLFSLLYEIPKMKEEHHRRHVPEEVTLDTIAMFENQIGDYICLNGRYGICTYVRWMHMFVKCKILRIGRFNLEIRKYNSTFDVFKRGNELKLMPRDGVYHRSGNVLGSVGCEDEEGSFGASLSEEDGCYVGLAVEGGLVINREVRLPMNEWERVLTSGDTVVSVHIPTGGPLTPEVCDEDLRLGEKIISECFTDFKMFYCSSWLLDTSLRAVTGKEGNVTRFGDRFLRYPVKSAGKGVFEYVYHVSPDTPYELLSERNSFERSIKEHLISGGHIYGAGGVFERFGSKEELVVPCPMLLVVDDVGWFNGKDDRANGGPSRTGMTRNHKAEDIRAINRLGEAVGMKINCAFVVGEWDPDNRLRSVPHLSKYGDGWDNAAYLDRDEMARYVEAINSSPFVEIAVHGLLHGYYSDEADNSDMSDYYYKKNGKLVMTDAAEVRTRVEKFREMLAYYGINQSPTSFVPPSFAYRLGELSRVLSDVEIKYISTIFRTMQCDGERPELVCTEGDIVTLDRYFNLYSWYASDCPFDDLPPIRGILGLHWPNLLHHDVERNDEVVDRAIDYLKRCSEVYGVILSRGVEFSAMQSLYTKLARVEYDGEGIAIDLSSLVGTPAEGKPFVVSTRRNIAACEGGGVKLCERKSRFASWEILPTSDTVRITFEKA